MIRRIPITRSSKPIPRHTPPRKISARRAANLREYAKIKVIGPCQAEFAPLCTGKAVEKHHLRGRDGDRLTDEKFIIGVCGPCHRAIHAQPGKAIAAGLLLLRSDPIIPGKEPA
jgi:hypothetical protein